MVRVHQGERALMFPYEFAIFVEKRGWASMVVRSCHEHDGGSIPLHPPIVFLFIHMLFCENEISSSKAWHGPRG